MLSIVFLKIFKNFYFFFTKRFTHATFSLSRENYKEFRLTFSFLFSKMILNLQRKGV